MKNTEKYVLMHTTKNTYRSLEKHSFIDFLSYEKCVNYIVEQENLFDRNRTENGRFCNKYYNDECGNKIADHGDKIFDIDGNYNTYRILRINELDINDWLDIFETETPYILLNVVDNGILEQIELELRDTPYYDNVTAFIEAKKRYESI